MKKLSKIKLQNLSQEELGKREQELLRGGYGGTGLCGCVCVCPENICVCKDEDGGNTNNVFMPNQGTDELSLASSNGASTKFGGTGYGYGYGYGYGFVKK